jgi:hypothetical protein
MSKQKYILAIQCEGQPDNEIGLTKKQFDDINRAAKLLNMTVEEFVNYAVQKFLDEHNDQSLS